MTEKTRTTAPTEPSIEQAVAAYESAADAFWAGRPAMVRAALTLLAIATRQHAPDAATLELELAGDNDGAWPVTTVVYGADGEPLEDSDWLRDDFIVNATLEQALTAVGHALDTYHLGTSGTYLLDLATATLTGVGDTWVPEI